jgi:hypothetical protein
LHHTLRRDFHDHLKTTEHYEPLSKKHKGGSLGSLLSDGWNAVKGTASKVGSSVATGLKRTYGVLDSTARSVGVQADVLGDKFLHQVGLRDQKKYVDAEVTDPMRLHARIAQSAYGATDSREDVDGWKYQKEDSTDNYATYVKDGKAIFHFRGTRPKEAILGQNQDLIADARIAAGTTSSMSGIDDARIRIRGLLDKYGDHNVNLSSYSLGGGRMLQAMEDQKLYGRLGSDNWGIAPGVTTLNPSLKKYAGYTKAHYAFAHNDGVANALLAHKNDHMHVNYGYNDPLTAHTTYLKDLAA